MFGMGTGVTPPLESPENLMKFLWRQTHSNHRRISNIESGNVFGDAHWRRGNFKQGKFYGQASRPISTGKLHALLRFHIQPITW